MQLLESDLILSDCASWRSGYDRQPFGYRHSLAGHPLLTLPAIRALARLHTADDYFVARSARTPQTRFYDVSHGGIAPVDALDRIETGKYRVILKRPERYDVRYRDLRDSILAQVRELRGGSAGERITRMDSAILVNGASAITPLHFDPEISFFFQIAGNKSYHLFDPGSMTEPELEGFYVRGKRDIGQVGFEQRSGAREYVFELAPGMGMHQPQNTPHWVATADDVSISYVVSIETEAGRALGRTRGFNYVQRRLGVSPAAPGTYRGRDAMKSHVMRAAHAAKAGLVTSLRAIRARP